MPDLPNHFKCTGCSACLCICPCGAIRMEEDAEGFVFPLVDEATCIGCGRCEQTCPIHSPRSRDERPTSYAAKAKDPNLVAESSSGGLFTLLAERTISSGGVVFGAAYVGAELKVAHISITVNEDIGKLRGSKYVQSDIGFAFRDAKGALQAGKPVLFSGTPCQIAGLKAYLGRDYDNLLTAEVICHGVPPPKLFRLLKEDMAKANGKDLVAISFRDKANGWNSRVVTGWYENGVKIRERGELNDYFMAFLAHLTLRHSCESCLFNDGRSQADITLGDFWGVERILPEMSDDTGVSAVIVHSGKGMNAFMSLDCIRRKVQLVDVTRGNPSYLSPRRVEKKRNSFLSVAYRYGINCAWEKYGRPSLLSRLIGKGVRLLRTVSG